MLKAYGHLCDFTEAVVNSPALEIRIAKRSASTSLESFVANLKGT